MGGPVTTSQAQTAVSTSAFVVAAVFAYRKLVEPASSKPAAPTSHFILGFGFAFIALSLIAQGAPELGAMMAILVATGDALANGKPLLDDVTGALKRTSATTSSTQKGG